MALSALHYARVNALVRGMVSRLLGPAEWQRLLAANDVPEVLRLLADSPYGEGMQAAESRDLLATGRALRQSLVDAYDRLIRSLGGPRRNLVVLALRVHELDNLKAILRAIAGRVPRQEVLPLLFPLGRHSRLPVDALLEVDELSQAVEVLAGFPYGRVLGFALERYAQERTLFPVEVALDLDYYRRLWAGVEALGDLDRAVAVRLVGTRYDVLNLDWLIRFRLLYRLSPQEIFNYTLPHGYRLTDTVIRRAGAADDLAGIVAELPQPYREILRAVGGGPTAVEEAELRLYRHLTAVARSALVGYPFQIGEVLAYLWLREAEVHDLEVVLEGTRTGRTADAKAALLWGHAATGGR